MLSDFEVRDGVACVLLRFQPFAPSTVNLRLIHTDLLAYSSSGRHRAYEWRCFDDNFAKRALLTLRDILQVRGKEIARLCCLTVAFRSKECIWMALILRQILLALVGALPMPDDEAVASNLAGFRLRGWLLRSPTVQHRGRIWLLVPLKTCSRLVAKAATTNTHF